MQFCLNVCETERDLQYCMIFFHFPAWKYVQEAKDHAGGCHSVYLYQHALQSHGSKHPTRHQGAARAYAGCGAQVRQNGFIILNYST